MTATAKSPAQPAAKGAKAKKAAPKKKNLNSGIVKYKSPSVSLKRLFTLKPKPKPVKKVRHCPSC